MSSPSFKDRLTLDETLGAFMDQSRRYMLIRPEALMGMFRLLPAPERSMALEALAQSVTEQGGDSARAYRAMGGDGDALLATVATTAPQLGWGLWHFGRVPGGITLEVTNSPFAAGYGPSPGPVCHAITGMLIAVAGMVQDLPVHASETQCAATGAPSCRFEARWRD